MTKVAHHKLAATSLSRHWDSAVLAWIVLTVMVSDLDLRSYEGRLGILGCRFRQMLLLYGAEDLNRSSSIELPFRIITAIELVVVRANLRVHQATRSGRRRAGSQLTPDYFCRHTTGCAAAAVHS